MAAEPSTLSASGSTGRRRWISWLAVSLLAALLLVVVAVPGLRDLATRTWREMTSISPLALAAIFLLKVGQALFSGLVWRNALLCAWPNSPLPYGFVLGVEQGQVAVNTVLPARAGTWAMLGIFAHAIPGVRPAKLVAVWAVQSLAFGLFAAIAYAIIAFWLPTSTTDEEGPVDQVARLVSDRPLVAGLAAVALLAIAGVALYLARAKLRASIRHAIEGLSIVRPPRRYLRLLFLPSLISYAFNVASYMLLLAAFGIPVTIFTVALALGSNALSGALRITPGGLGTSQALDVIALRAYAPADVVTAYSLSEVAITAVASISVAVGALLATTGLRGTRNLLTRLRTGEVGAGVHTLNERQRALRQRARHPRSRTGHGK